MVLKALLFDLDDTLWQFPVPLADERLHRVAAEQLCALLGDWGVEVDAVELSHRLHRVLLDAVSTASASLISIEAAELADQAARDLGLDLGQEQLRALWQAWHVDPARLGRQAYPDARSTLSWAHENGYRLGVVSNYWFGAALLQEELRACGLEALFDAVVVSCEAGWLKPHPEIFHAALHALGVAPDEALMVGDSLSEDVRPAMMTGMRAVWKRNGRRPQPGQSRGVPSIPAIDDLWELQRLPELRGAAASQLPAAALAASESPDRYQ